MLLVTLSINNDTFGLDASNIIEIIPVIPLKHVPLSTDYIAGLFNYHGQMVPVIDLCKLFENRESRMLFSTRIILVKYTKDKAEHVLGVIAENITECIKVNESNFVRTGVSVRKGKLLGEVASIHDVMVQRINIEALLPDDVHEILFTDDTETDKSGVVA